jgi:hypothetical protein
VVRILLELSSVRVLPERAAPTYLEKRFATSKTRLHNSSCCTGKRCGYGHVMQSNKARTG